MVHDTAFSISLLEEVIISEGQVSDDSQVLGMVIRSLVLSPNETASKERGSGLKKKEVQYWIY